MVKPGIYARAGIPEYWIVNLDRRLIEVHRDPEPEQGRYAQNLEVGAGEEVRSSAVPELVLRVAALFA